MLYDASSIAITGSAIEEGNNEDPEDAEEGEAAD
jgi:hypothetical protein